MLSDKVQPHPSSCQTGYRRRLPATALVLVLCAAPVSAQTVNTPDSDVQACNASNAIRFRGATARLENDLFADTDQNYTSGVAFTAVSHDIFGKLNLACLPAAVRLHAALISYLDPGFWADALPYQLATFSKTHQDLHRPHQLALSL